MEIFLKMLKTIHFMLNVQLAFNKIEKNQHQLGSDETSRKENLVLVVRSRDL